MIDLDISKEVGEFVGDTLRTLALDIDRRVVLATPVRDGGAKRNWLASVGTPNNSVIDVGEGIPRAQAEQAAIDQGSAIINGANDYETIYISNNLPYIQRLDQGWSEQQPNPYIDQIITEEVSRGGN